MGIQIYSQKSNAWRDAYNPLRGMGLPKLLSLLDAGERGQYADLQWFYHFMVSLRQACVRCCCALG
jgi:hypothetical protein